MAAGRKVIVAAQADVPIAVSGDANHVVIDDGTNIYVTTCSSISLLSGGTVNVPTFDIEVRDPA